MTSLNKFLAYIPISLIKLYQIVISPILPSSCRFYPTCSQYTVDALKKYGIWRGTWLGFKRIIRCHPFNPGGYDPLK